MVLGPSVDPPWISQSPHPHHTSAEYVLSLMDQPWLMFFSCGSRCQRRLSNLSKTGSSKENRLQSEPPWAQLPLSKLLIAQSPLL